MKLELEDRPPVADVSEPGLRRTLGRKKGGDNTFAILEADDGSYVQMLGGGTACCLEWRNMKQRRHYRAFVNQPKVPWREPSLLGQMQLNPQEILFIEQVVEAFCAFLNRCSFPSELQWRDVTEELVAKGVKRP